MNQSASVQWSVYKIALLSLGIEIPPHPLNSFFLSNKRFKELIGLFKTNYNYKQNNAKPLFEKPRITTILMLAVGESLQQERIVRKVFIIEKIWQWETGETSLIENALTD